MYIAYDESVIPYKAMEVIREISEYFVGMGVEEHFQKKEKSFKEFKEKYKQNFNKNYWSGLTLDKMIAALHDRDSREGYDDVLL